MDDNTYYAVNLKQNIIHAFNNIRSEELQSIYRNIIRRAEFCTDDERKRFENALVIVQFLNYISRI